MKSSEMSVLFINEDGMPIGLAPFKSIHSLKFDIDGVLVTLQDGTAFNAANSRKDIRDQVGLLRLWRLL